MKIKWSSLPTSRLFLQSGEHSSCWLFNLRYAAVSSHPHPWPDAPWQMPTNKLYMIIYSQWSTWAMSRLMLLFINSDALAVVMYLLGGLLPFQDADESVDWLACLDMQSHTAVHLQHGLSKCTLASTHNTALLCGIYGIWKHYCVTYRVITLQSKKQQQQKTPQLVHNPKCIYVCVHTAPLWNWLIGCLDRDLFKV